MSERRVATLTPARTDVLRQLLRERGADAAFVTHLPDVRWACGFTGSNGVLVVRPDAVFFVSDKRYEAQAHAEVEGAEVHIPGYDLFGFIEAAGWLGGAGRVLFQPEHVSVAQLHNWRARFEPLVFEPAEGLLTRHVAVKTGAEVAQMRQAQAVTDAVFDEILGVIAPGMTEREVAAEIVYRHLRRGAEQMSFEPIVAGGPRGALPHARPTDRRLEAGELVVLDFGCFLGGYASDMTRTVALGEPGDEARRVYEVVRAAQQQALDAARAGLTTKALDAEARGVIEAAGYGAYFGHGLGHGIGLETHAWPRVSYHTEDELPAGVAITVEPGIYLPGRFGVRIEDIVVLRADGCENLTGSPKDLIVV